MEKYQPLKIDLERLWEANIPVIPIVIDLLGAMRYTLTSWFTQIPGYIYESDLQKSALLGNA